MRFTRVIQLVATVVSLAAAGVLAAIEHYAAALGVAVTGGLLVASTLILDRRSTLARASDAGGDRPRHRLAVVLRVGHVLATAGLVVIVVGAALAVTGAGERDIATILLVWVGPFTLVAAAGVYSAYGVQKREYETMDTVGDPPPA